MIITYLFYFVQRENDLSEHVYRQLTQAITYEWLGHLATQGFWPELHLNALAGYIAAEIALKVQNVDYLTNLIRVLLNPLQIPAKSLL